MSRVARELSWHAVAFALVVAGLTVLAPLAWQHSRHPAKTQNFTQRASPLARQIASARSVPHPHQLALERASKVAINRSQSPEPQIAPLGPLIADQIDLDPSVSETPALQT
jgi:hypothetical protein